MGAPGFWDDQANATRISTEHSRLTRKLDRYERLQGEFADAGELLSLGEDEDEIATARRVARRRARPARGGRALHGRVRHRRRSARDPRGHRRNRRAGLGRHAAAHVPSLGVRSRIRDRGPRGEPGRGGGAQVRDGDGQGRERVRHAEGRAGRPSARAAVAVRLRAPQAHGVRAGRRRTAPPRRCADRDRRVRPPHRHVPLEWRRRVST